MSHRVRALALLALGALMAACRGDDITVADGALAQFCSVTIRAALAGMGVEALTVVVSGAGIASPIVANADVSSNAATATVSMDVPTGGQRTFTARGLDAHGVVTHEGMTTVRVRAGTNAPVVIRMYARTGDVPVDVGIGAYDVVITPAVLPELDAGATRQLSATITDAHGTSVPGAVATWGSLNPQVATVSASGLVTARGEGFATIWAVYRGSAASLQLVVVAPPSPYFVARELALGLGFTCALDDAGAAWCWGANDHGQLGDGTTAPVRTRPVPVAGGLRFTSLTAGTWHACGLTATGEAWCWGRQLYGALGNGLTPLEPARTPQQVLGGGRWQSLDAGTYSTCGLTLDGQAWCWGTGVQGRLGLVPPGQNSLGVLPGFVSAGPWRTLSTSFSVSCAIAASNAEATCDADFTSLVTTASAAGIAWRTLEVSTEVMDPSVATPVPTLSGFGPFACGLSATDGILCWGSNVFGQLGTGTGDSERSDPTPIRDAPLFDALTVGGEFACALSGTAAFCWGRNDSGQLGIGTLTDAHIPIQLTGIDGQPVAIDFSRVKAGLAHACGVRIDGAVLCWGANRWGEVGDGTTTLRDTPVGVALPGTTP